MINWPSVVRYNLLSSILLFLLSGYQVISKVDLYVINLILRVRVVGSRFQKLLPLHSKKLGFSYFYTSVVL